MVDPADLRSIPLFDSLHKRELDRVARWTDDLDVEAGRHLVDQGAFAYEFFVIIDGQAEVLRDGAHVADLGPGDFFGEMALVETDRRTASVVARTRMRVAVMLGRDFREMEDEMPHVAKRITEAIEQRRPQ
jgi:CRP/FNR family transcriptional regulator, cyclic AMP receptor protein